MRVAIVPCLKDNFAYLVIEGGVAAVVDPGEAEPVLAAVAREGVRLAAVWATHHHMDHVGGLPGLLAAHPGLEVLAGERDAGKIEGVTRALADGDEFELAGVRGRVLHNPGHTLGAITFVIDGRAFTGDTLFGGGCGRVFEGDPAMMHASLERLAALPPATEVYFGHEYTAANLRFAAAVEPDNADVARRVREIPTPSTPSTIELERATNPFLRSHVPAVIAAAGARGAAADGASVFGAIRAWKNDFK
ncbi:MAG: hydroxyacylglutathione hydrolase [Deltaproteobacteria bacterium]|nr:hydroxyacylglutathione hydrolase [Deltaproteobacteria bacterium]